VYQGGPLPIPGSASGTADSRQHRMGAGAAPAPRLKRVRRHRGILKRCTAQPERRRPWPEGPRPGSRVGWTLAERSTRWRMEADCGRRTLGPPPAPVCWDYFTTVVTIHESQPNTGYGWRSRFGSDDVLRIPCSRTELLLQNSKGQIKSGAVLRIQPCAAPPRCTCDSVLSCGMSPFVPDIR